MSNLSFPTPAPSAPTVPSVPDESVTPLMKQYWELKRVAGEALLLFRMGDFYELFGDDAIEAARILEITLTSRDKNKPNPMPMAGVPHHALQGYLQRLLKAGKIVSIAEQFEEAPATKPTGKTIVRREIVRTFTPAIQFDNEGVEANYLATALPLPNDPSQWVLACMDSSTGETLTSEPLSRVALALEASVLPIRHFLRIGHHLPEEVVHAITLAKASGSALMEDLPSNYLSDSQALELLSTQYGLESLTAFVSTETAAHALGMLVSYATRSQHQEKLSHLRLPSPLHRPQTLILGPRTAQHLDLIPSSDGSPSLYQLINRTRSALGARQLKRWILEPLKNLTEIQSRQQAVRELVEAPARLENVSEILSGLYDLERLSGRINARLANPRDTLVLGKSLGIVPGLLETLAPFKTPGLASLRSALQTAATNLQPLCDRILKTQRDDAPLVSRDGGIFNPGTTSELDRLLSLTENGQRWLIELETREREATGIASLKVRYNRVFGYYIEVTQTHLKNVPAHYQRKQTTVGAERFFTEELKKFEDEIITASTRQKALEQQLFEQLVVDAQTHTTSIMALAQVLGEIDSLVALARLAFEPGWNFPVVDKSMDLEIQGGRHPLVDTMTRGSFVPNDLTLSPSTRLTLLITGPNMGGKSTVMRQVALILILGQMGAPVPAASARWGVVSSLYTRIGAHDAISRGQSTFMVEMSELAHILHHADERSFIILDEIGRGTSTYDGMSVAWSTLEWICRKIGARTLFATHYHELTRLDKELPGLANAHMAVEGTRSLKSSELRFLYELRDGFANESFGIHVARIAGLPAPVIERAWTVLEDLESQASSSSDQLPLFSGCKSSVEKFSHAPERISVMPQEILNAKLNEMTPLEALNLLAQLQETARGSAAVFS